MREHPFWKHFQSHGHAEHHGFAGRGRVVPPFVGPGGPRGGRRGFFGFGGGGPGGFDVGRGRKLSSGELQLVLLALLHDKPRHGYDLIKAIDEKSGGFYVPSPGVIYPALTYLEEAGEISATTEGSRKLYTLTDEGRAHLDRDRPVVDEILKNLEAVAERMGRVREAFDEDDAEGGPPARGPWAAHSELGVALRDFHMAMKNMRRASPDALGQVVAIIRRAAAEIRAVIDDEPGR